MLEDATDPLATRAYNTLKSKYSGDVIEHAPDQRLSRMFDKNYRLEHRQA